MENIPQKNDIKAETFLNPENMPAVPASEHKKQKETFHVDLEYQMMLAGVLFDKAIRPNMTAEEIDLLATLSVQKQERDELVNSPEVREFNKEFYTHITKSQKETDEENEKQQPKKEEEDEKIKVYDRAVVLMCEFLEKYPKLKRTIRILSVSSALTGCAGMPYTANSMMQTGLYGIQQVVQTQIHTANEYQQANNYGNYRTNSDVSYRMNQTKSSYDEAMFRAGQNRIIALNRIRHEEHREPTQEEVAPIEAQYKSEVDAINQQAESSVKNVQFQAKQNINNNEYQKQQILEQGRYQTGSQVSQTVFNIFGQAVQATIGGHGYHGGVGARSWYHGGRW